MALLNVLKYPDPKLKTVATPVENFDDALGTIIDNMFETLYEEQGVGLAATQVNIHQRIIVIDVSREGNQPIHLVNPEIIRKEQSFEWEEGCLSFLGVWSKITRYKEVEVKYFDRFGKSHQISASNNLLCACLQHEIDHINGITFFDRLSQLKRALLEKKLQKL
jgi:peptide deformylase